MFKKASFLVSVFTLVGVCSIIHSNIALARNLDESQKHSAHPLKTKHKAYKFKTKQRVIQKAEQSIETSGGGCQGQCSKPDNFQ